MSGFDVHMDKALRELRRERDEARTLANAMQATAYAAGVALAEERAAREHAQAVAVKLRAELDAAIAAAVAEQAAGETERTDGVRAAWIRACLAAGAQHIVWLVAGQDMLDAAQRAHDAGESILAAIRRARGQR